MSKKKPHHQPTPAERDERVSLHGIDPEAALEALLQTGPSPSDDDESEDEVKD